MATYVNVLGADLATQCIEAELLDEVLVFIAPVLLGDGVLLFRRPGGTQVRLTPMPGETAHWYSVVLIRFTSWACARTRRPGWWSPR